MTYPSNTWIWCSPEHPTDDVIGEAKSWIRSEGYDAESVKLVKTEGMIVVVAR